jgi:hypothetical protein
MDFLKYCSGRLCPTLLCPGAVTPYGRFRSGHLPLASSTPLDTPRRTLLIVSQICDMVSSGNPSSSCLYQWCFLQSFEDEWLMQSRVF